MSSILPVSWAHTSHLLLPLDDTVHEYLAVFFCSYQIFAGIIVTVRSLLYVLYVEQRNACIAGQYEKHSRKIWLCTCHILRNKSPQVMYYVLNTGYGIKICWSPAVFSTGNTDDLSLLRHRTDTFNWQSTKTSCIFSLNICLAATSADLLSGRRKEGQEPRIAKEWKRRIHHMRTDTHTHTFLGQPGQFLRTLSNKSKGRNLIH